MRVHKLKVFKPVARVLGARRAKRELSKVKKIRKGHTYLPDAFVWRASPQGHAFWRKIHKRLDPNWPRRATS